MSNLNDNTLLLQRILGAVNNLPAVDGGAVSNIAYGTFTTDAKVNTNTIAIEHGLGSAPDLVVVFTTAHQATAANRGSVIMAFDTAAMKRYHPSANNQMSVADLDGSVEDWVNDTTFTLAYAYWYYGVGDHHWFAIKRGA